MHGSASADVVVLGGGIVGCAVARAAARAGLGRVVMIERHAALGLGATSIALGGLRFEFDDPVSVGLSREGIPAIAALEAETGVAIRLAGAGYALLATDETSERKLRAIAAVSTAQGVAIELLDPAELGRRVLGLRTDDLRLASLCAADGLADPGSFVAALSRSGAGNGVAVRVNEEAAPVIERGRLVAVEGVRGRIACGACVVATGEDAPALLAAAGVRLPLVPTRRRIFFGPPLARCRPPAPLVMQLAPPFYFHVEPNATLLSAAEETPIVGAEADVPDDELRALVAERAAVRLPELEGARLRFGRRGVRVVTPDGRPLVGAAPCVSGLFVAVGLGGQGIMHALAVANIAAAALAGGDHPLAAALRPDRFAAPA